MRENEKSNSSGVARAIDRLSGGMNIVSMVMLVLMMLFVAADVIGRYFFNMPVKGSSELIELMMAVLVYFALAYCTREEGDARVDVLYVKFPAKVRAWLDVVTFSAGLFIYLLITWRLTSRGVRYLMDPASRSATDLLKIPYWPFILLAALGSLVLCIQVFRHILGSLRRARRRGLTA